MEKELEARYGVEGGTSPELLKGEKIQERKKRRRKREKEGRENFPEQSLRENVSWCIMSHVRDKKKEKERKKKDLLVLLLGSLGPSTVTLIALV